jgi:hypothetical protein
VAGLDIPAGSAIQLSEHTDPRDDRGRLTIEDIEEMNLPVPTRLMGALLDKRLTVEFAAFWNGTLIGNQQVHGRSCAAGGMSFTADGAFWAAQDRSECAAAASAYHVEEEILYPAAREALHKPDEIDVNEAYVEHFLVKSLIENSRP